MTEPEVVDATAVEEPPEGDAPDPESHGPGSERESRPEASTALAVVAPTGATVAPQVSADDLVARMALIREVMQRTMIADVDYGVIPGTGSKPTLLKPGAEKLGVEFQLDIQFSDDEVWGPGDHYRVKSKAIVYHAPTGQRLGSGEGICSTREKKYGKRQRQQECPSCGVAAIKRSKYPPRDQPDAEAGFYCFAKIGGCGANFAADTSAITSQPTGEIENPDMPDQWNTVLKMAHKRARIDAVLAVTGASALFTQDVEDHPHHHAPAEPVEPEMPWWAVEATDEKKRELLVNLSALLNDDADSARALLVAVKGRLGLMPAVVPAFVGGMLAAAQELDARVRAGSGA